MALTYPKKYKKDINLKTQNREITNLKDAKQQDLNRFVLHRMTHYKDSKYNNTALWEYTREDFIGQIKETQAPIKKNIVQNFCNFLRENRVFIPMDGGIIGDNIQKQVLNAKEEHKWTL